MNMEIIMKRFALLLILTALFFTVSHGIYAKDWSVLTITNPGQGDQSIPLIIANVQQAAGGAVNYTEITNADVPGQNLADYDVVWTGWNANSQGGTSFRIDDADQIADYVEAGGIVACVGTDDDGWNSDWLPAPVTVLNTGDYDLEVTDDGRQLFNEPNVVDANAVTMDERYAQIDPAYTILAWGVGTPDEAGAIQIERGQGMYVMVSIDTRDATLGQAALPLMENMLNHAFDLAQTGGAAVEPSSKLAATWGAIKQ